MSLTKQKQTELECTIYEYCRNQKYVNTCDSLMKESDCLEELDRENLNSKEKEDLLQRKWTMLSRQQQKILQLETRLEQLQNELNEYKTGEIHKKIKKGERYSVLPVEPYRFELSGHRDSITCLSFHPYFPLLASASDDASIIIWDYESGLMEKSLRGHTNNVNSVAFDPTGKYLVSCSADLTIRLWDMNTREVIKVLTGHEHNISSVCFLPTGDKIVSVSRDNTIKIWEIETGFCKLTMREPGWVRRVVCNSDGTLLATCNSDNNIRIWNLTTQQCIQTLRKHTHIVECINFSDDTDYRIQKSHSPDDGVAANGSEETKKKQYLISGGRDKMIYVWNIETAEIVATLKGHDSWVKEAFILPNMTHAISCSDDRSMRIWDLSTDLCIKNIKDAHPHFVTCMKLSRQRPVIATGGVDTKIRIWECR